ncbi:MarR family winged helix-turn-helix transcriptional regulator [Robertmurraya korlensis]|jgi:DNA-binding MarR family transcriptional regulator|uniref:MarR family winged helix-turn-helix transcriptional regulator n=1 Tax=Robertmurraya korlensis TaxID=519977 RepID=UPI00082408B6|nr:MarR family transcriptional regulator [Robertmurraya korlensis]
MSDLIDLVSDKHAQLRGEVRQRWIQNGNEDVTPQEYYLMTRLEMNKELTIAETARKMNISRQAAHKCAKGLIEKDLITAVASEENLREKLLQLTTKGLDCCKEMTSIKEDIVKEIVETLGAEKVELLKEILKANWYRS